MIDFGANSPTQSIKEALCNRFRTLTARTIHKIMDDPPTTTLGVCECGPF